jgi:hypothetical protein
MKYHKQDGHAPNAIELRDFLSHSVIGRKGSGPLPREAESAVRGLVAKYQESILPSITNREDTHYANPICHRSRKSREANPIDPRRQWRPPSAGQEMARRTAPWPSVTGRNLRATGPKTR